ncbi:MAG TPA: ABC transporter permease [Candidatus Limnocylindrales bacterium]
MRTLVILTAANLKSFVRDRAGMFWTLLFPVVFVLLFGMIFSGTQNPKYSVGWVDQDGTQASARLASAFGAVPILELKPGDEPTSLDAMRKGNVSAVIVVPKGYGAALAAAQRPSASPLGGLPGLPGQAAVKLVLYTDPSHQTTAQTIQQIVGQVAGVINQQLTRAPDLLGVEPRPLQTENISNVAYIVPSILAMALMQLGLFGAIPLVEQREKLILKRLGATPLKRWTLVGSNVLVRLLVGVVQAILILGIGATVFHVTILGSLALVAGLVLLGAATFIALGYVVASFARTEEAASQTTSILQFPLMFLSGIFFPFEIMPDFMRAVGAAMPLTYLGDAMRQVMVNGAAFAPLSVDVAILAVWLVVCLGISARFFRWQ